MSTQLRVVHATGYRYSEGATASFNEIRMIPRSTHQQQVLHSRVEISPVVKFLIDEDRVRALTQVYAHIAGEAGAGPAAEPEPDEPIEGGDDA